MAKDDLEYKVNKDRIKEIIEKYMRQAKEKQNKQGKTERMQEDYDKNPVAKLKRLYEYWDNFSLGENIVKRVFDVNNEEYMKKFTFTIDDMQKFHNACKNDDVLYNIFMCSMAERIKLQQSYPAVSRTELHPFFESGLLLPQLIYLAKTSSNAKIRFKDLDTVILYSCRSAYLSEFETGKLIVDCDSGEISGIGSKMKGGQIIITKKTKLSELFEKNFGMNIGYEMIDGEIIIEKDLIDVEIGRGMINGNIIINGNLSDYLEIGYGMKGGDITINGNVDQGERSIYGTGACIKGGTINITGSFSGHGYLGKDMEGGRINVKKYVDGNISVGQIIKGNSFIQIDSDCRVNSIGYSMEGGEIRIKGNARRDTEIGRHMKNGRIKIGENATQMLDYEKDVGKFMEGGKINIRGNVERAGDNMSGGTIDIIGTLDNKKYFAQSGGRVYENGKLIKPKLMWRLLGRLEK